jgi:DNA-binding beta-propeller fold protein YncE
MISEQYIWDFFIAHAGADKRAAEKLYDYLQPHSRVFLDSRRLKPGDDWDTELPAAQQKSLVTVVLISSKTQAAYYQREEIAAAIALTREDAEKHRVVPVFLDRKAGTNKEVPYGLRLKHGLTVSQNSPLKVVAETLINLLYDLTAQARGIQPGWTTRSPSAPDWLKILSLPNLREPTGLAVDGSTLYVADHSYGHVLRIDIDRGQVVGHLSGLDRPHHVAVMKDRSILVTDTGHHRILCLDSRLKEVWSRQRFGGHRLLRPHGVAATDPEEFYVLSSDNHCLLWVSHGKVKAVRRNPTQDGSRELGEFATPCGVGLAPYTVYVADTFNHRVQVFTSDLQYVAQFGSHGHGPGEFHYPVGIASWHEWLVIADETNQRLQLWRTERTQTSFRASCVVENLCPDWLASPFGTAFSPYGSLYVADRKRGKVLEIEFQRLLAELTSSPTTTKRSS